MARLNLLDVAKLNGTDKVVGLIEESVIYAPELNLFPARSIRGTSFPTSIRTAVPVVGFRQAGQGNVPVKSSFRQGLVQTFILSAAVQFDREIGKAYEDGMAAYEMIEAAGVMEGAMRAIGSQIFYGVTQDADGFPGLKVFTPKSDATMCLSSGGSDANVQSSVYAVKFGTRDCEIILGQGGGFNLSPFRDENFLDADNATVPGRVADLGAWVGLAINNTNCVKRLCNVGADTETGDTVTDAKLQQLLDLFPTGVMPDAIFMSKRSRSQLQRSRSVTLFSSGGKVNGQSIAAQPKDYDGVPIIATDSILNTDAVEA